MKTNKLLLHGLACTVEDYSFFIETALIKLKFHFTCHSGKWDILVGHTGNIYLVTT